MSGRRRAPTPRREPANSSARRNITSCLPPRGGQVHIWLPGTTAPRLGAAQLGAVGHRPAVRRCDRSGQSVGHTVTVRPSRVHAQGADAAPVRDLDALQRERLTILAECDSSGNASLVANGPSSNDSELTVSGESNGGTFARSDNLGLEQRDARTAASGHRRSPTRAARARPDGSIGYQKASSSDLRGCAFFGDLISG